MNPPDRSIVYRVSRNGHVMGEFDIDRIVELLDSGEFLWTDLCWSQGMAGWGPLSNLRAEVAAAKAFPPVVAVPAPVASGRRHVPPKLGQSAVSRPPTSGGAGWTWILAGIVLGALVGLLCSYFFPTVVHVDRPVDRIVDRPVEVVRTVERRVEVPAVLSSEQQKAIEFYSRFYDFSKHRREPRLFAVSNKVKIITDFNGDGLYSVSQEQLKARLESVFRSQGFVVLSENSQDYPYSVVRVVGNILDSGLTPRGAVVGACGIEIFQTVTYLNTFDKAVPSDVEIKTRDVLLYNQWGSVFYGRTRFGEIVDTYVTLAEGAARELRKASEN